MGSKVTIGGDLMFPGKYVAAPELRGKDVTLTIKSVSMEELVRVGGKKDRKPVVMFNGARKGLVLNVTNANTIAAMYGPRTEDWVGKPVTLFPTKAKYGREIVDAIRIRPGKLQVQQPQPATEEDQYDAADKQRFVDELRSRAAEFPDQIEFVLGEIEQNKDWLGEVAVNELRREFEGRGKVG